MDISDRYDLPKQWSWHIRYPGTILGNIPLWQRNKYITDAAFNLAELINDVFTINNKIVIFSSALFVSQKIGIRTKDSFSLGDHIKKNKSLIKLLQCFQLHEDEEDEIYNPDYPNNRKFNFDCCFFSQNLDYKCIDDFRTYENYYFKAGIYIEEIKLIFGRNLFGLDALNPNRFYKSVQIEIMEHIKCSTPLGSIIYLTGENQKLFSEYILNRRSETTLNNIIFQPKKEVEETFCIVMNVSILGWCKEGTKYFWYCRTVDYGLIKIYFSDPECCIGPDFYKINRENIYTSDVFKITIPENIDTNIISLFKLEELSPAIELYIIEDFF